MNRNVRGAICDGLMDLAALVFAVAALVLVWRVME